MSSDSESGAVASSGGPRLASPAAERAGSPGVVIDLALVMLVVASAIQFSGRLPPIWLRWLALAVPLLAIFAIGVG